MTYEEIMDPDFSEEQSEDSLLDWEQLIEDYEHGTDDRVSDMQKKIIRRRRPRRKSGCTCTPTRRR